MLDNEHPWNGYSNLQLLGEIILKHYFIYFKICNNKSLKKKLECYLDDKAVVKNIRNWLFYDKWMHESLKILILRSRPWPWV